MSAVRNGRSFRLVASLVLCAAFVAGVWGPLAPVMAEVRSYPATGGASTGSANTWTGTQTFGDEAFLICDDGTGTKCLEFEASGISAATTRTITVPDVSITLAGANVSNTWSAANTFAGAVTINDGFSVALGNISQHGGIGNRTEFTPDAPAIFTGTVSNSWHMVEVGDAAFDFQNCSAGTSAQSNPTLCFHSSDQATNEWAEINVDTAGGTSLKSAQELYFQSGQIGTAGGTALTGGAATAIAEISVAQGAHTGGVLNWTVVADDGTDFQSLSGVSTWAAVNKAGTETCPVPETHGGATEAASVGTLTASVTCTTGLTDVVQLAINATSSLVETTLVAYWTLVLNGPGTVTPQ